MTDTTMRSLLDVHRTELNEKDAEIEGYKRNAQSEKYRCDDLQRKDTEKARRITQLEQAAEKRRTEISEKDARIKKLQEANESLNSLLTSERSAFSAYRDTHPDVASAHPEDGDGK